MFESKTFENEALRLQRTSYSPNVHMPLHTDKLSKISIVLAGSLVEKTAGTEAVGNTGSVIIKPNHALHENRFGDKPVTLLTVSLKDDAVFSRYFDSWQFLNHPKIYVKAVKIWTELRKVRNECQLNSSLRLFTSEVLPQYEDNDNCFYWYKQLKNLLTQDLTEPESISIISQRIALHRVYMGRKFKKFSGTSPSEYRHFAKTASALVELLVTDKSISSIAFDNGFADQSHLTRTIKRQLGFTPAKFRKMAC
jgi:AraC family transcriptional regulator